MKVKDLIKALKEMPQEAEVFHLWDGEPRTCIQVVYESKNGNVVTADFNEVAYSTEARPKEAPATEENQYWQTKDGRRVYFDGELEYIGDED